MVNIKLYQFSSRKKAFKNVPLNGYPVLTFSLQNLISFVCDIYLSVNLLFISDSHTYLHILCSEIISHKIQLSLHCEVFHRIFLRYLILRDAWPNLQASILRLYGHFSIVLPYFLFAASRQIVCCQRPIQFVCQLTLNQKIIV